MLDASIHELPIVLVLTNTGLTMSNMCNFRLDRATPVACTLNT